MNTRVAAFGIALALPILLSASDIGLAQQAQSAQQDTTQTWRGRGMQRGGGTGLRARDATQFARIARGTRRLQSTPSEILKPPNADLRLSLHRLRP